MCGWSVEAGNQQSHFKFEISVDGRVKGRIGKKNRRKTNATPPA
jgi:hypothetical protein